MHLFPMCFFKKKKKKTIIIMNISGQLQRPKISGINKNEIYYYTKWNKDIWCSPKSGFEVHFFNQQFNWCSRIPKKNFEKCKRKTTWRKKRLLRQKKFPPRCFWTITQKPQRIFGGKWSEIFIILFFAV